MMITLPGLAAEALGSFLADDMRDRFGVSHARLAEIIPFAARLALECIGNSDALYHNVEHTMLVTLAGHDIFKGRALLTDSTPDDYSQLHRRLPDPRYRLRPRRPQRGRARRLRRRRGRPQGHIAARLLRRRARALSCRAVEAVRAGSPGVDRRARRRADRGRDRAHALPLLHRADEHDVHEDAALLRAADLIGQLGDPHYLRKANALYHEFEEIGLNGQLGYESPADLVDKYPQFYWNRVSPYIQDAIRYLNVTASGRQWINGLYSNVFRAEHEHCASRARNPNQVRVRRTQRLKPASPTSPRQAYKGRKRSR